MRREEGRRAHGIVGNAMRVRLDEALELARVLARDPARELVARRRELRVHPVLVLQAMGDDFELKLSDRAEEKRTAQVRAKHLDRAFLAELLESAAQLLALQRVRELDA